MVKAIPPAFGAVGLAMVVAGLVADEAVLVVQGSLPIVLTLWALIQRARWPSSGITPIIAGTFVAMWIGVQINPQLPAVIVGVIGLAATGYAWLFLTKLSSINFAWAYAGAYGVGVATWGWGSTGLSHLFVGLAVAVLWLVPVPMFIVGFRSLAGLVSLKNLMVTTISHEFRGPLSAISGLINTGDDSDVTESIDLIRDAAQALEMMTEDLLVALLPRGTKVSVNPTTLDMLALVSSVATKEFTIEVTDEPMILGDELRTRQILNNLISNTSRYGGPSREIRIGRMDGYGLIEVRDNGDGVPVELEKTMFTAFASSGAVSGSLGIGLAVSHELAVRMSGELTYAREAGETVFSLRLPLA